MSAPALSVYPLGGLGEIGLNCMAFSATPGPLTNGLAAAEKDGMGGSRPAGDMVLIDCGLQFPEDYLFGVDVVIPRFDFVLANKDKLRGIVLTHGHEDHIGALPWLLPFVDVPVYGSEFTLALVRSKLVEHNLDRFVDLRPVKAGDRLQLGCMTFEFFRVCHSIVEGFALGVETPVGRVFHTGDFKIDLTPLHGAATDLDGIRRFCQPDGGSGSGAALLLSDSTNVEREGRALTERQIQDALSGHFDAAPGRILVTLFSSHIQRMQEIFDLSAAKGRKVFVSGRSLSNNIEIARELGLLRADGDLIRPLEDLPNHPDHLVTVLLTGSQGEPLSALSRVATGEHRQLRIHPGDLVIMSSRFIPGNVRAITKLIDKLYKLGAEVLYESIHMIHASGHAHKDELRTMLETVRPKYFVPLHGEYRHLVKHRRLAVEAGVAPERAFVLEDGHPLTLYKEDRLTLARLEEPILVERIMVDGKGVGDVGQSVLKERQLLAGEGLVVCVLVIDEATGALISGPDILSKGFVFEQSLGHVLEDAKCVVLDIFESTPPSEVAKIKERVRSTLRRFFRKVLERDPVVVPVVLSL